MRVQDGEDNLEREATKSLMNDTPMSSLQQRQKVIVTVSYAP